MAVYKQTGSKNWWYKFHWNGELIRESTKQTNKRVAETMEAARRTALAKGEVGIRERKPVPTLKAFTPRFEETVETVCAEKPGTVKFYKAKMRQLLADDMLAKLRLDHIDEDSINGYVQRRTKKISRRKQTLSPASVNRELATLRRLLRLAHEWRIIEKVPRIRLLRGERNREFVLNHAHEVAYLNATVGDIHDVSLLILDTGLRMGEALSLNWSNIRLEPANGAQYGFLTVGARHSKNSKSRNVPLTVRVLEMLKERGRSGVDGLVFHREDGTRLCQTWLNEQQRKIRDLLSLPEEFVPHSLRHTFGTRLGEAGADAFTIMKLMGHSTITVSQRYVHPSPEAMDNAVSRMEAWNRLRLHGVGTNLDTVNGLESKENTQAI